MTKGVLYSNEEDEKDRYFMGVVATKPCCKHKDTRPMDEKKKLRLQKAILALKTEGRISADEFYAKFENTLSKSKKR